MLSNLDPVQRQFLNNLNKISDRMTRAQQQISTGLTVVNVSDSPDQVSTLLAARAHLEAAKQVQSNIGRFKAEVDGAEQSLQASVQLFERARTLAAEGNTAAATAQSRASLAQEIGSIMEQLVGQASTTIEGRYVFSGDSDQAPPYTIDLSQTPPVSTYQGSAATRLAEHPNGSSFAVAHTAQEVFDSTDPSANVFSALNAVRLALLADDADAIGAAFDALAPAESHLNSELAFYGTTQNKIAEAQDYGSTLQVQLQTQITSIQEGDLTNAILELNQSQVQQQAAMDSYTRIPRTTLFDFLS